MRLPDAIETVLLILAVFFPFYWYNQSYLSKFSLQLVALLILIFVFHNWLTGKRRGSDPISQYQTITIIMIITVITVILVLSTGGAGSMLFWLLDFLLFFVAVFFRARAGFIIALAIGIGFLLNEPLLTNQQLTNLISLLLMAPLAAIFSTQFTRLITAQKEIKVLSNQAKEEEMTALIWLALDFRNQMVKAIDLVSQIKSNLSLIPYHQREKLDRLYQNLKDLFKSGQELKKTITIIMIIIIITVILPRVRGAAAVERMESNSYKIRWPNLNMTSGSKSSSNYNILDTLGQTAPGEYDSTGFKVKAGFPYIKTIIPFSFTISDLSIDFGTLVPGVFPSPLPTNTLTISSGGAAGYSVTAIEDRPLTAQSGTATIPDTTCDSDGCSETTAGVWTNTAKYGFGYNLNGNDVPAAFADSTYFKQFADASQSETAQIVMSSSNVGKSRTATVTYKVNIAATQTAGDYENNITYVATPSY